MHGMRPVLWASLAWEALQGVSGQDTTPLDFTFKSSRRWRVVNDVQVTYGWAIGEIKVFDDPNCQNPLTPISATGYETTLASPNRTIDGHPYTEWRAPCHICEPKEAWLTLYFDVPVTVMCIHIFQWGDRDYAAKAVVLQRADEVSQIDDTVVDWVDVLRGHDLKGGGWDDLHFVQCAPLEAPNFGLIRLTNNGFYPSEATFSCKGIRPLTGSSISTCKADGQWSDSPPTCWEAIHFIAAGSAVLFVDVAAFVIYYRCFMSDKSKPLTEESMIPQDYLGKWNSELFGDFTAEPKLLSLVVFCPCCRLADTWQQAGILAFQFAIFLPHFFFCCLPCIGSYFRNLMRQRFNIRRSSATLDCLSWSCVPWLAAVQEAKMVDAMCVVAHEEANAKEAVDKRKAEADAKAKGPRSAGPRTASLAPSTIGAFKVGLSTKTGALRKPKSSLEMISSTAAPA